MDKSTAYAMLVSERVACRKCAGLANPASVANGSFDSLAVGPWSRWQGNLNAKLMVIGQDWGDVKYFTENSGRDEAETPTNKALRELVGLLGIDVGSPSDRGRADAAFFTNAILCLKSGGLQGKVRQEWFGNCSRFLRRQVEIVAPTVLVCLGERAYRALGVAFSFMPGPFRQAVENPEGVIIGTGIRAFARYHCGRRIQNSHRPLSMQRQDWLRLRRFL
jgi:uracil-DNA glycosylase